MSHSEDKVMSDPSTLFGKFATGSASIVKLRAWWLVDGCVNLLMSHSEDRVRNVPFSLFRKFAIRPARIVKLRAWWMGG